MPVNSTAITVTHPGNGSAVALPVPFEFLDATHLVVTHVTAGGAESVLQFGVDYTVTKSEGGGTVTRVSPASSGESTRIERFTPLLQPDTLQNQGALYPARVEAMVNRNTLIAQEIMGRGIAGGGVPTGGNEGQVLARIGETGFGWQDEPALAELGSTAPGKGAALVANAMTTNTWQDMQNVTKAFYYTPGNNVDRFLVSKTNAPTNFSGSVAPFIVQHKDDADLAPQGSAPGAIFWFESTGDGAVDVAPNFSSSIWMGLQVVQGKSGDGSAHNISLVGSLGPVGSVGYNELGLLVGDAINDGSTNGIIHGAELLLKDGTPEEHYPTFVDGYIARIQRWNANAGFAYNCFVASAEGTVPLTSILNVNNGGSRQFEVGLQLSNAIFTSGVAAAFPNNTSINFLDQTGTGRRFLSSSNVGVNLLWVNGNSGKLAVVNSAGTSELLRVDQVTDPNNPVAIYVNGVLKKVEVGAPDSGGAGYRMLRVVN